MKTNRILSILVLLLCAFGIMSCSKDGRQITDRQEYTLTVASKMLPGVLFSCGANYLTDVYAVKVGDSDKWSQFGPISGFDYTEGYEYEIKIRETSYLDYRMGEPAWTEYELIKVISKVEKDSEDLPSDFVPDWFIGE